MAEGFDQETPANDLSEEFFNELFAEQTNLSDGESILAILKDREESDF